jgi:uracil-DNA glycosylase
MGPDPVKAVRELLSFYLEAGVDICLSETPVDRFDDRVVVGSADRKTAGPSVAAAATPPGQTPPHRSDRAMLWLPRPEPQGSVRRWSTIEGRPDAALMAPQAVQIAARETARRAASLEELRAVLERFEGCALKRTAKKLVFSDGNPQARVMFVGEAPGREEDLEGLPFVGRSGKLLDRMLAAIGLDRKSSAYIANIIPWRPPGNRTPTPQEAAICLPFIRRQIELSQAQILVCLGGPSAQALLGVKEGIVRTRGRWFKYSAESRNIRAIATLHPAYLLRQPLQKRFAWRDFLSIKKALESG